MILGRRFARSLLAASSLLAALAATGCSDGASGKTGTSDPEVGTVPRPPQYVLLAFDGSLNNDFWTESRAFARDANVKFTYFISGTYFIPNASKNLYVAPHGLGPGKSAIGFGGDPSSIAVRYKNVQGARDEGHEMGSHANGHFDGSDWSEADWESEFTQFDQDHVPGRSRHFSHLSNFGREGRQSASAPRSSVTRPGLYTTLAEPPLRVRHEQDRRSRRTTGRRFRLTASGTSRSPRSASSARARRRSRWTTTSTSQDSKGTGNGRRATRTSTRSRCSIRTSAYFQGNYYGNRAPIHIGHHFSKWNGGAYWEAMQDVQRSRVCGLPEVKCVTYKDLLSLRHGRTQSKLSTFQAGNFPKMPRPPSSEPVDVSAPFTDEERAEALQAHENHDNEDQD